MERPRGDLERLRRESRVCSRVLGSVEDRRWSISSVNESESSRNSAMKAIKSKKKRVRLAYKATHKECSALFRSLRKFTPDELDPNLTFEKMMNLKDTFISFLSK